MSALTGHDAFEMFRRAARLSEQHERELPAGVAAWPGPVGAIVRAIEAVCDDYGGLQIPGRPDAWQVFCVRRVEGGRRQCWWLRGDACEWFSLDRPLSEVHPPVGGPRMALARGRDGRPPELERLPLWYLEQAIASGAPQQEPTLLAWALSVWRKEFYDAEIWRKAVFEPGGEWPAMEDLSGPPFVP